MKKCTHDPQTKVLWIKLHLLLVSYYINLRNYWVGQKVRSVLSSHFSFNIFIFGCIGSSLLRASFLQLLGAGATLHCGVQASHCSGFSCCGARALGTRAQQLWLAGSRMKAQQLWCTAQLLHGMWDLPGPGLEPVSPALAGGFLTTAPPGRSPYLL